MSEANPTLSTGQEAEILGRLDTALKTASKVAKQFINQKLTVHYKDDWDPVTEADREVNEAL